jgi:hypothetical protein
MYMERAGARCDIISFKFVYVLKFCKRRNALGDTANENVVTRESYPLKLQTNIRASERRRRVEWVEPSTQIIIL